jgi:hypothetical protein
MMMTLRHKINQIDFISIGIIMFTFGTIIWYFLKRHYDPKSSYHWINYFETYTQWFGIVLFTYGLTKLNFKRKFTKYISILSNWFWTFFFLAYIIDHLFLKNFWGENFKTNKLIAGLAICFIYCLSIYLLKKRLPFQ